MKTHTTHETTTDRLRSGQVLKKTAAAYAVRDDREAVIVCTLAGRLRGAAGKLDPVAVGDHVRFAETGDGSGTITEVLPRTSKFSRPAAGKKPVEQVIVANLDQVVAVFAAARPEPKWNSLDRYLVSAEASALAVVICITKLDLGDVDAIEAEMDIYRALGYPVILTSAATGQGIDALRSALEGRISALVGKSGVGKTSLLNALEPGLGARVGTVSAGELGKGWHTTTGAEMFPLAGGGHLVDTPGVRSFGLWEVDGSDVSLYFPEFHALADDCRFGGTCRHDREPGCAVRAAAESGALHARRYQSYLRLLHGDDE